MGLGLIEFCFDYLNIYEKILHSSVIIWNLVGGGTCFALCVLFSIVRQLLIIIVLCWKISYSTFFVFNELIRMKLKREKLMHSILELCCFHVMFKLLKPS